MDTSDKIIIPKGLTLKSFQEEAVRLTINFLKSDIKGCYNASEPGLGKTIHTLAALNTLECIKTIILSPAGMRRTWFRETKKWSTLQPRILVVENSEDVRAIGQAEYVIISYELARANVKNIKGYKWDALVADESHKLKNLKAKVTQAVLDADKGLWLDAKYHICLSGTPCTNDVADLFSLCNAFDCEAFPNYWAFVNTFCNRKETPWGTKYVGVKNAEQLSRMIRSRFYFRFKKEDVLKDLPPKTYIPIYLGEECKVKYTKEELAAIERYKEQLRVSYSGNVQYMPKPPESFSKRRREQGLAKVPSVAAFVRDLLEQEIPVILFAYHIDVIEALHAELDKFKPSILYGATSPKNRAIAVDRFQAGETLLFIGQIQAAGVGITLTRSSTVVLCELDWSPAIVGQAVDRAHRIGQQNPVMAYYFQVENSIDEDIETAIIDKAKVFYQIIDGKDVA